MSTFLDAMIRITPLSTRMKHAYSLRRYQWALLATLAICFSAFSFFTPVKADDIHVMATVPAPLPPGPAIITYPHDQDHFATPDITVLGTCPDATYVELYRNDIFAGVAWCTSGAFSIPITLLPNANKLQAKIFNITNNEGPTSPPITVYYTLLSPPTLPPASTQSQPLPSSFQIPPLSLLPSPYIGPLLVTSHYSYFARYIDEVWKWDITIMGGSTPYIMTVDWNDGSTSTFQNLTKGPAIGHVYAKAGLYHLLITVTDKTGNKVILQLLAVVKSPNDLVSQLFPNQWQQYTWLIILTGVITLTLFLTEGGSMRPRIK